MGGLGHASAGLPEGHDSESPPKSSEDRMRFLDWTYRYGFTLIAGIVLLFVVIYYTRVLDQRSYQNAIQIEQINANTAYMQQQLSRIELKLASMDK